MYMYVHCARVCVCVCTGSISLFSPDQLKDHQGHPYTARDVRIRLSEPAAEPLAEVKLHQLLNSVVRWSEASTGPRAEFGDVTTNGEPAVYIFIT